MQGLQVDGRFWFSLPGVAKYPSRSFEQLIPPLLNLIGMDVKILGKLDQGLLAGRPGDLDLDHVYHSHA